jgi:hypothetical protein
MREPTPRPFVAFQSDRINVQGVGYVFGLPPTNPVKRLAAIPVGAAHNGGGYEDAAGLRHGLQSRGDVHTIAEHVAIIFDDVAEIDADAQLKGALGETGLDFDRGIERFVDTWEGC